MRSLILAALAAVTVPASAALAAQPAAPAARPQCFFTNQWQGWKAAPDGKAIYIGVKPRRVFRVDFVGQCPEVRSPGARLITESHSGTVCRAIDLDIRVSNGSGFSTPCLVDRLTALSPAEVAALPKALVP